MCVCVFVGTDDGDAARKRYKKDLDLLKPDLEAYNRQKEVALGLAAGALSKPGSSSSSITQFDPSGSSVRYLSMLSYQSFLKLYSLFHLRRSSGWPRRTCTAMRTRCCTRITSPQKRRSTGSSPRSTASTCGASKHAGSVLIVFCVVSTRRSGSRGSGTTRRKETLPTSTSGIVCSTRRCARTEARTGDSLLMLLFTDRTLLRQVHCRDSGELRAWNSAIAPQPTHGLSVLIFISWAFAS